MIRSKRYGANGCAGSPFGSVGYIAEANRADLDVPQIWKAYGDHPLFDVDRWCNSGDFSFAALAACLFHKS
jgi:hypothetical protein